MRAPFAPPRLSEPRNVDADAQAVETSSETERPDARILRLQCSSIAVIDQRMIHRRDRVLPDQSFLRHEWAKITRDRAHVAVRELEPGAGECVGELIRVFIEAPRDLLICRIEPQREIGGQHRRQALLCLIERVRYGRLPIPGLPLFRSRRTRCQLPLVFEQVLEEQIAPLRWRLRPDDFRTAA